MPLCLLKSSVLFIIMLLTLFHQLVHSFPRLCSVNSETCILQPHFSPNYPSYFNTNVSSISLKDYVTGHIHSFLGHLSDLKDLELSQNSSLTQSRSTSACRVLGSNSRPSQQTLRPNPKFLRSLGRVSFRILELVGNQLTRDSLFLFREDNINKC